ncbi:MAG: hypothetical protein JWO47_733 [Candidatus Saccharibacteria bacterium]|nr:hypothetical protein [Candidatus Saccharibacteria bacterium]
MNTDPTKQPTDEELGMPTALWNAQALEGGVNIGDIVALERQRRMALLEVQQQESTI